MRDLKKLLKTPAPWDKSEKGQEHVNVFVSLSVPREVWEALERLGFAFAMSTKDVVRACLDVAFEGDKKRLLKILGQRFGSNPRYIPQGLHYLGPYSFNLDPRSLAHLKKQAKLRNQRRRLPKFKTLAQKKRESGRLKKKLNKK